MKRIIVVIGLGLVILVIAVVVYFRYMATKPLYKPGMVRAGGNLRAPLTPPEQTGDDEFWQVEEDIQLYHFSVGEGKNVLIVHGGPGFPNRESWSGLEPLMDDYQFHYYDQRGCGKSTRPIDTFSSSFSGRLLRSDSKRRESLFNGFLISWAMPDEKADISLNCSFSNFSCSASLSLAK